MNARDRGRSLLLEWEAGKPTDFYEDDAYLRLGLRRRFGGPGGSRGPQAIARAPLTFALSELPIALPTTGSP